MAKGLRDKILRGDLGPGQPLRENAIALALKISRNTVREAVRLLEQSGLVKYEFNRGTVVIDPSVDDLMELYCARLALEVAAVSKPAIGGHRPSPRDVRASSGGGRSWQCPRNSLSGSGLSCCAGHVAKQQSDQCVLRTVGA